MSNNSFNFAEKKREYVNQMTKTKLRRSVKQKSVLRHPTLSQETAHESVNQNKKTDDCEYLTATCPDEKSATVANLSEWGDANMPSVKIFSKKKRIHAHTRSLSGFPDVKTQMPDSARSRIEMSKLR